MMRAVLISGLVLCASQTAHAAPAASAAPPAAAPPAAAAPPVAAAPPAAAAPAATTPAATTPAAAPAAAAPAAAAPGPAAAPAPAAAPPTAAAPPVAPTDPAAPQEPEPAEEPAPDEPADEPAAAPAAVLPAEMKIPPPLYKGRGRLIGGTIVGVVGLIAKIGGTVNVIREARSPTELGVWGATVSNGLVYNPLIAGGLLLTGSGLGQRGEYDAHHELFDTAAHEPKMKKSRRKLGWGLFGGGLGVWLLSRAAAGACPNDGCTVGVLELGYYASVGLTVPGVALGAWSSGHDNYIKRFGGLAGRSITVTPMGGRVSGLSMSGRF